MLETIFLSDSIIILHLAIIPGSFLDFGKFLELRLFPMGPGF